MIVESGARAPMALGGDIDLAANLVGLSSQHERRRWTTTADRGYQSRRIATSGDSTFSLSIEEALARYDSAGISRTRRSVQRYCANGSLDAHRIDTEFGDKFLIKPDSLEGTSATSRKCALS